MRCRIKGERRMKCIDLFMTKSSVCYRWRYVSCMVIVDLRLRMGYV